MRVVQVKSTSEKGVWEGAVEAADVLLEDERERIAEFAARQGIDAEKLYYGAVLGYAICLAKLMSGELTHERIQL